jgi:hypothetical protein
MDYRLFGFLISLFVVFTQINRVIGGVFLNSYDATMIKRIAMFTTTNIYGLDIMTPNLGYFDGLGNLFNLNYTFFGGNADMLLFLIYSITGAAALILFISVAYIAWGALSRVLK